MLRALYNYKATYPSAVTFSAGEMFVEIPGAKMDRNWYYVTSLAGKSGFVPKNYMEFVKCSEEEKGRHLNQILENISSNRQINSTERKESITNIDKVKSTLAITVKGNDSPEPLVDMKKSTGSRESLNSVRSSKKRAAPKPPSSKIQDPGTGSECSSPRISPRPPSSIGAGSEDRELHSLQGCILEDRESRSSSKISEDRHSNTSLQIPGQYDSGKFSHQTSLSSVSTDSAVTDLVSAESSVTDLVTVTYQHPQESCRAKALDLIEMMRHETELSHATSTDLLKRILVNLAASQKDLNVLVPSLINELKEELFSNDSEIMGSNDYTTLTRLLDELTQAKEDDQQRNWMLHEDEEKIIRSLQQLDTTLRNAKIEISKKALQEWKYSYVQNLVEYFQMETRWSIRRILIETFTTMASIDAAVISVMLNSVLPLELAQDMFENSEDSDRLKHSSVLLTIIFSQGESVPVHYLNQLGVNFLAFILHGLENPPQSDIEENIPDAYMGLLASYNLQFKDASTNLFLESLAKVPSAKIFTEKLLLLLNREEDPAQLLSHRDGTNSIHKLVLDVFSNDDCIAHFYTNDLMVLIDIIARQLCDLGPGVERYTYLEMAHLVLVRSGYEEHLHRLADLQVCLSRIQREEGQSIDKLKASEICNSFTCFK